MKKLLALLCSAVALFAFSGCDIEGFFGVDQFEDPKHPAESSSQLPEESSPPEESSGAENPEVPDEPTEPEEPEVPDEPTEPEEPEVPEVPDPVEISFNVGTATRVEFAEKGSATLEGYVYGRYTITWDESITNLVVYYGMQPVTNGTVISVASPMMVTQLSVSTSDGAAFAGDILIEKYVPAPVEIQLGENFVVVDDAFEGVIITYTAMEKGTLNFAAADGETNGELGKTDETGTEWVGFPYSVAVEAKETVTLIVTTLNWGSDTVDFTLTFTPAEPEVPDPVEISFKVGTATRVEFAENGSATLKGYVYGRYSITWDTSVTNLVVSYDGQPITNGTIINVVSDMVVTQLSVSTSDGTAFTGDIMIEEYVSVPAGPIVIQTGANSVQVDDAFVGVIITYTATDEGFIYFKAAADETNGALGKMGETDTEWVGFPYSMAVEAGQKVTFIVTTTNMEADTVDFTLTFSSNYTDNY